MAPRACAALAVVFWGVSFVATKAVVREISPLALVFARAGLGTVVMALLLALRGESLKLGGVFLVQRAPQAVRERTE